MCIHLSIRFLKSREEKMSNNVTYAYLYRGVVGIPGNEK